MSSGDETASVVQQKKEDNASVNWREYVALRDHLTGQFGAQSEKLQSDLASTDAKVVTLQQSMAALQQSMDAMNRSMQVITQRHGQPADVASVHGEHEDQFGDDDDVYEEVDAQANARRVGRGEGRAAAPPGRGFAPLGRARRVLHNVDHAANRDDDGLGKPKFSIPKFEGSIDVEEYINWELKMEQLWRLHDYTEDRKIKLASSEFDGYALLWWHGLVNARREANELPIRSWREMKEEMQHRFVPRNYRRSLYDKLQNLKQGTSSVDEYYKEMELIMQRAKVREEPEQTMQRFLSGLNFNVKRIVRHYQYAEIEDLLHQAREAES